MFRVGQKVVCVETWDRADLGAGDEVGPVAGQIYTVRAIGIGLHPAYPSKVHVLLCEIRNPQHNYQAGKYEAAFRADRFRPVVERKTDISMLTALLVPGAKIREDA